jgi:uncharacterized protein (TIGR03067 family)
MLLGLTARAADPPDKGVEQLKGKWLAIKGTWEGKPLAKEDLAEFKIILEENGGRTGWQGPFMGGGPFHNLGITFDLTTSPKRLYLFRQIGFKGTTYPGIFKLDGDRLIVCWNLEPWTSPDGPAMRPMPKEFAAPKGSGLTLLIFEKSKE